MRGLEAELDRVQKELKAAKEEREKKAREGMDLVRLIVLPFFKLLHQIPKVV